MHSYCKGWGRRWSLYLHWARPSAHSPLRPVSCIWQHPQWLATCPRNIAVSNRICAQTWQLPPCFTYISDAKCSSILCVSTLLVTRKETPPCSMDLVRPTHVEANYWSPSITWSQHTITWTPDILSLRSLTWNCNKCPCFCTFPLEFGGVSDLHTHQNRRAVC